jgi:hypothetical protein
MVQASHAVGIGTSRLLNWQVIHPHGTCLSAVFRSQGRSGATSMASDGKRAIEMSTSEGIFAAI